MMRIVALSKHAWAVQVAALFVAVAASVGSDEFAAGRQSSGYLDVGGSKIYYETCGVGPVIALLHDGLLDAVTWDEVWQPLATGHRVVRYDRRGYGRSDPATASFSPEEDLAKLLRYLQVEHALIAGSSSGGALAIDFAVAHPELVDGLFLIGPVLHGMEFRPEFGERAKRNNEPMERGDVKAWAANWSQDRFLIAGSDDSARRKVYEQLVANAEKLKNYDSTFERKLSPPAGDRLSEIKVPTAILVGEADIADVQAHSRAINAGIRGSTLHIVKQAGHLIQLEKPGEVIERLRQFEERSAGNAPISGSKPERP
jgi:3-oxoadipate enol-lactonase